MKTVFISLCLLLSALSLSAQDTLTGIWNTGQENTKIEITEADGVFTGAIHSSDNEKAKIGAQLLKEVKPSGEAWKGKLYSAKRGKWYNAELKPEGNKLLVTVKAGFMSKTIEWTKG